MIYDKVNTLLKSPEYDISIPSSIPVPLKSTHKFLLRYVVANYEFDVDGTYTLYYKNLNDNTEKQIAYTMIKANTFFKQKLPSGILPRQFRYEITAVDAGCEKCFVKESGVIGIPVPTGQR